MTTKIVIHAGFHKTGTTSVQAMLRANAKHLSPHIRVFLKDDFQDLTVTARNFSIKPTEKTLRKVSKATAAFFSTLDQTDPRPILMSSEDLSGHMPGRHGLECYDSSGLVMKAISDAAVKHFGPDVDLTFFFSTRGRASWLRSTWWQNLRSTRLTQDLAAYTAQFDTARYLDDILQEIAADVAPFKVVSEPLEQSSQKPLGPLSPLLDLVAVKDLDHEKLQSLPPENVQPDAGIDRVFLALNQSALPDKDIQDAKRSIRIMARKLAT